MTREEQQLEKRLLELGELAYRRGIATYSDFLNLNELNIFQGIRAKLSYLTTESFGGYELAERQIAAFQPEAPLFCTEYPIRCLSISPLQEKFAEELTHRDYLGAVLNLGLDRSCLGDILVEGSHAYLFCLERMAPFICDNLTRVRHTTVYVRQVEAEDFHYEPRYKEVTGTVASVRLDRLLSLAFGSSRSSLTGLIEGGKVFVNGKLVTSNGYQPKEGDLVSVRGLGRFRFQGSGGQSRKGREYVTLLRYI
ncbi:MAG TPA: RNA-binding protein [Candidatus Merdisoma merdipullorum]|nr:RNA-binding protein [Candidatus Merdisoma merdipullorum]